MDELEAAEAVIRGIAARYDRTLARFAEDQKALAADEAERSARNAELEGARAAAQQAEAAADADLQSLLAKVNALLTM